AGVGGASKFDASLNNGAVFTASAPQPAASWWDKADNLLKYDVIVLSCEGQQHLETKSATALGNLQTYINKGGRVFASHWHNAWIQHAPMPLSKVATWTGGSADLTTIQATIDA